MKWITRSLLALLTLFIYSTAWATPNNPEDPRAVIENTVNAMIHVLEQRADKSKLTRADRDNIRKIVTGKFDYTAMARRSLGKPWKKLDANERNHFTEVFRELLERSYGNRLAEYKGQHVRFENAQYKGKKARVASTVIDGSRETPVNYRMHQTPTGWQVYDIRIEGTSMVRTFYQDFKSVLKSGGYPHLLSTLEEKIAKLKAKDRS